MVHKILSQTEHTYTLDNGNTYKYYELQKVDNVHAIPGTNRRRIEKEGYNKKKVE